MLGILLMGKENGEVQNLINTLENRIRQSFSLDKLLCYFTVPVESHITKKNNRPIFFNKARQRHFIGKDKRLVQAEEEMILQLKMQRISQGIMDPICDRVWIIFHFYFKHEDYFTKKGEISLKLPDLSNLYELPQDSLQKAGILLNDTQVESHDLSRRLYSDSSRLDIFILKYDAQLHDPGRRTTSN